MSQFLDGNIRAGVIRHQRSFRSRDHPYARPESVIIIMIIDILKVFGV